MKTLIHNLGRAGATIHVIAVGANANEDLATTLLGEFLEEAWAAIKAANRIPAIDEDQHDEYDLIEIIAQRNITGFLVGITAPPEHAHFLFTQEVNKVTIEQLLRRILPEV